MPVTKGWHRCFDEPIPLPRGRQLVTLKDAIAGGFGGIYVGLAFFVGTILIIVGLIHALEMFDP
jgi:hypothetical protein